MCGPVTEDELGPYLRDIASDARHDVEVRAEAMRLWEMWSGGIMPAPKRIRALRKMTEKYWTCGRLNGDGSCAWLRKNALDEGLPPPKPGQRVYCKRVNEGAEPTLYVSCPGFKAKPGHKRSP